MAQKAAFDAAHWDYVLSGARKLERRRELMEALIKNESPESAFNYRLDQFLLEYPVEWSVDFSNDDNEYKITNIAECDSDL